MLWFMIDSNWKLRIYWTGDTFFQTVDCVIKIKEHNFDYWRTIKPSNKCVWRLLGYSNLEKIM